ncbi:pyridoxamine 5'-phosphate oxidase family protein [Angustibacter aerolatus]|uniref:PPOX class F420-dependent enzyme n=1 Tax=Angustibacter aerolatus TaxID=1162965 RepID=A0ABQ6JPB9_9ACTN|nr:pyridoxamine 5'-phosphate oxidase family protein [Angustibacter aerolatus]GMA89223.1 PPOX class F420-dependent enzyme [Angustibacter aerolatus]
MPKPPLPEGAADLLRRPCPAVVAVLRPGGDPMTVATWYLLEDDGRVLVNMDDGRARLAWMRDDPRVALTALEPENWGNHVSVRGRVVEWRADPELADIDRLSTHYTGNAYPVRDRPRTSALVEIEAWHGWQGGRPVEG